MTELSTEARELLDLGRAGLSPSDDARARVRAAVLVRVGVAAAATTSLTGASTAAATAGAKAGTGVVLKVMTAVALAGGVGTVGYVATTSGEPPAPAVAPAPPPQSIPASRGPGRVAVAEAPSLTPLVEPAPRVPAGPVTSRPVLAKGALAVELEHLREARRALQDGDAAGALAETDAYDDRYPDGGLAQEMAAIRIDALCALGESRAAAARAASFLARWPESPLVDRVRASCAVPKGGSR